MTKLFYNFVLAAVGIAVLGNIPPVTATTLYGSSQGSFEANDYNFSTFHANFLLDSATPNTGNLENTVGVYLMSSYDVSLFDSAGEELATLDTADIGRVIVTNLDTVPFDIFDVEFFNTRLQSLPINVLSLRFELPSGFFGNVALPTAPLVLTGGRSFALGPASNSTAIVGNDASLTLVNTITPVPEPANALGLGIFGLSLLLKKKLAHHSRSI
jgi:hypothetical protein